MIVDDHYSREPAALAVENKGLEFAEFQEFPDKSGAVSGISLEKPHAVSG
jgi:hypothetical protein